MNRRVFITLAVSVAIIGVISLAIIGNKGTTSPNNSVTPSGSERVVQLTRDSGTISTPGHLTTVLLKGTMPSGAVTGVVTTDKNCTPDQAGYSHCTNDIRIAGSKMIEVRHNHMMSVVPCLEPGEHVIVRGA